MLLLLQVLMAEKNKKIAKDMTFAELMEAFPKAAKKLAEKGMFCCGCPMAMQETLEQGAFDRNTPAKGFQKTPCDRTGTSIPDPSRIHFNDRYDLCSGSGQKKFV